MSTKTAWEFLNSTYAPQQNVCCIYQLYEEIFFLKQEDRTLKKYYIILQDKWDELSQYHPLRSILILFLGSVKISRLQNSYQVLMSNIQHDGLKFSTTSGLNYSLSS